MQLVLLQLRRPLLLLSLLPNCLSRLLLRRHLSNSRKALLQKCRRGAAARQQQLERARRLSYGSEACFVALVERRRQQGDQWCSCRTSPAGLCWPRTIQYKALQPPCWGIAPPRQGSESSPSSLFERQLQILEWTKVAVWTKVTKKRFFGPKWQNLRGGDASKNDRRYFAASKTSTGNLPREQN